MNQKKSAFKRIKQSQADSQPFIVDIKDNPNESYRESDKNPIVSFLKDSEKRNRDHIPYKRVYCSKCGETATAKSLSCCTKCLTSKGKKVRRTIICEQCDKHVFYNFYYQHLYNYHMDFLKLKYPTCVYLQKKQQKTQEDSSTCSKLDSSVLQETVKTGFEELQEAISTLEKQEFDKKRSNEEVSGISCEPVTKKMKIEFTQKFCTSCGTKYGEFHKFCSSCGEKRE